MRSRFASRLACAVAVVVLVACGSSPTEPTSSSGPQTSLRLVVTRCDLGGSIVVGTELGTLGTLPTPGEATFYLPPGPHTLTYRRGNEIWAGVTLTPADVLSNLAPGATTSIVATDPPGVCMTSAH